MKAEEDFDVLGRGEEKHRPGCPIVHVVGVGLERIEIIHGGVIDVGIEDPGLAVRLVSGRDSLRRPDFARRLEVAAKVTAFGEVKGVGLVVGRVPVTVVSV